MICVWSGFPSSECRRPRTDRRFRGPDRPYSHEPMNQGFSGMRHPGIKRPSNRETRSKAKLRANASSEDAVACRTRCFRPWGQFSWSWRLSSPICARLRTLCAKRLELGDYSGRLRRLIVHRFRTAGFGCISVRNSSFEIFPRNLRSVSRNSHGWILCALWFTFPR